MPDYGGRAHLHASSGNKANAAASATITATDANHTPYLTGFEVTASGSTAALVVTVTVTGVVGGVTLSYSFAFPAGVGVGAVPLIKDFSTPLQGTPGGSIVVSLPPGGSGNVGAAVNAHGFQLQN